MIAAQTLTTRELNKRARRERILDAACELLREDPDSPWTVERIAQRAGVVPATVFNRVGTRDEIWAALVDRFAGDQNTEPVPRADPQLYARKAVDEVIARLIADAAVSRALIVASSRTATKLERNPTYAVGAALRVAVEVGTIAPGTDVKRLSAHVGDAVSGALHQWAVGLISSRELRLRCRDAVDITFAAARPGTGEKDPASAVNDR